MTCARCGSDGFGCYECTPDPFAIIARLTADRDAWAAESADTLRKLVAATARIDAMRDDIITMGAQINSLMRERDAALAQVSAWQPIATAPRDETLFLATGLDGGSGPGRHVAIVFCDGAGFFDDFDEYTYLTHWMPLPAPPVDSSAAQATAVDDSTGADPVGKEG